MLGDLSTLPHPLDLSVPGAKKNKNNLTGVSASD